MVCCGWDDIGCDVDGNDEDNAIPSTSLQRRSEFLLADDRVGDVAEVVGEEVVSDVGGALEIDDGSGVLAIDDDGSGILEMALGGTLEVDLGGAFEIDLGGVLAIDDDDDDSGGALVMRLGGVLVVLNGTIFGEGSATVTTAGLCGKGMLLLVLVADGDGLVIKFLSWRLLQPFVRLLFFGASFCFWYFPLFFSLTMALSKESSSLLLLSLLLLLLKISIISVDDFSTGGGGGTSSFLPCE